jgi:phage tail-like protein
MFQSKLAMRVTIICLVLALLVSIGGQVFGWWDSLSAQITGTVARASREDPLVAFKYGLELEGKLSGYFTAVSGIGSKSKVVEEKVTNPETGETIIQVMPGRLTWTPVTLERGVTSSTHIWEWRQQVVDGKVDDARTNCSIVAYDQANQPIARWEFDNAWPSEVLGPFLDEQATGYMVESITIVHEGMRRVK